MARLGGGRRFETWLCWSTQLWSPVAVKMARPHTATDPKTARRLTDEAERVASLAHPSFQRVFSMHPDHVLPHIVFEYVEGPSLRLLLEADGPFDSADVAVIGEQLAWALAFLHANGLVHLDLKPENILLRDGRPVIVDLGLARPIGARPQHRLRGTTGYHAPEQLDGSPASASMDIYTFGLVLHELLSGVAVGDGGRVEDTGIPSLDRVLRTLLTTRGSRPTASAAARLLGTVVSAHGEAPFAPPNCESTGAR